MKIRKAVIPAAGLGTRFLPATKSMPKEMLPIIDKPVIHYVVEEAVSAGIDNILIITGRGKRAIEDYFDSSPELEALLSSKGKIELLEMLRNISTFDVHYIRQKDPRGLGDAILKAEKHIGDDPFAVLLGDDIVKSTTPCIKQLIDIFKKQKSSVIAVEEVPREKISSYGIIQGRELEERLYLIEDIIEKPRIEEAPSNIAAIGRYVFTPEIFDSIKRTSPGVGNEFQLADALKILIESQNIYASLFYGKRYDTGDRLGYVKAVIDTALENEDIGTDVLEYFKGAVEKEEMKVVLQ